MRISDWSSDVCSSDLSPTGWAPTGECNCFLWEPTLWATWVGFTPDRLSVGVRVGFERSGLGAPTGECNCFLWEPTLWATWIGFTPDRLSVGVRVGFERSGLGANRSEEHTSELQSLMRISYAVICLKKKK